MNKFKKKAVQFTPHEPGVKISELVTLIDPNDKLGNRITELLQINNIIDEYIAIPGAEHLIKIQKSINSAYIKEDIECSLKDISIFSDNDFSINLHNIIKKPFYEGDNSTELSLTPIYSASTDFFSELLQMNKYADNLIHKGLGHILKTNLDYLKEELDILKKYRILYDVTEKRSYLRAIISLNKYRDYNNNIAILIALVTLHNEMKNSNIKYRLKACEYNESFIKLQFESSELSELQNIGYVKNIIEVSNDEIKRESMKFEGICSILFKGEDNSDNELLIANPKVLKSNILSIRHDAIPNSVLKELYNITKAENIHNDLYKDILNIRNIKNVDSIRFWIKEKIDKARTITSCKNEILKILEQHISNVIQQIGRSSCRERV